MNASVVELAPAASALSCIVCGGRAELVEDLCVRLERSARVGSVERVSDPLMLEHAIAPGRVDLIVHVLATPDETLPRCLLAHATDVRVLVVAPDGVCGTLSRWLQQGANDLVSPDDEDALAHALSRLLDECGLLASLRRQQTVIDTQRRRIESLTGTGEPAAARRPVTIVDTADSPDGVDEETRDRRPVISRDGLPGRQQTLRQLRTLASRALVERDEPVIAVRLAFPFDEQCCSRLERTLCDLAICRAVAVIRRAIPRRLLLGRLRSDSLVLLVPGTDEDGERETEITLRRSLGTLGELLERPDELSIETLSDRLSRLAVQDLEHHFDQERSATVAIDVLQPIPTLTAHGDGFSPALAAGQS